MANRKYEFSREGSDLRLSVAHTDITLARLATAFEVSPSSLYIKEEWGDVTFWANDNGRFNLSNLPDATCLLVMGQSQNESRRSEAENCLSYTAPAHTTKSRLPFRPFSKKGKATSTSTKFGCKVILAKKNGKSFTELNQTYISVNEDTANVLNITEKVQEKWGKVALVAGNGFPIQDEEGTRGSKFWKCSSRRIYAIKECETLTQSRKASASKRSHESEHSSTDEDFSEEKQATKRKKTDKFFKGELQMMKEETSMVREELQHNNSTLEECKTMLQELTVVNKFLSLPPSVIKLVCDAFKCKICLKAPMCPPIIATRCCNVLLGCSHCVNEWYSGDGGLDKSCPHCREARGYAQTFQFKGIDEFLKGFRELMADPSAGDGE